jgi:ABC-type branched-subunit amino acid transport system ATPase component
MSLLEVKGVNKRFGGLLALDDVNLSFAENTIHAVIGPNGAGKSTLLNCFIGKLLPDSGTVTFNGDSRSLSLFYLPNLSSVARHKTVVCLVSDFRLFVFCDFRGHNDHHHFFFV